jgi:hypothetical protein
VAPPDPVSETEKEFDAEGVRHPGEQFVHITEGCDEVAPKVPIAHPFVVIRSHDPSVDVCPRSSEKIRKLSLLLTWKTLQESFCNGKESAKVRKKSSLDTLNVLGVADGRLNVREVTSAI